MRLIIALILLSAGVSGFAFDKDKYYYGHFFVYEKAEIFESSEGGLVAYLIPGGYDELYDVPAAILVEGVISDETVTHLRRLLSRDKDVRDFFLDSPGGFLSAGMRLGKMLSDLGARATIPQGGECFSACALAFLGGKDRVLLAGAKDLGFHRQYYLVDDKAIYGSLAKDIQQIRGYLDEIRFSSIDVAEIVGTTGNAGFSSEELFRRGIVTARRAEIIQEAVSILEYTKFSRYEFFRLKCSYYDSPYASNDPEKLSTAAWMEQLTCSQHEPVMREPLLRLALGRQAWSGQGSEYYQLKLLEESEFFRRKGIEYGNSELYKEYDEYLRRRGNFMRTEKKNSRAR